MFQRRLPTPPFSLVPALPSCLLDNDSLSPDHLASSVHNLSPFFLIGDITFTNPERLSHDGSQDGGDEQHGGEGHLPQCVPMSYESGSSEARTTYLIFSVSI